MKERTQITCCPHCGSDAGYFVKIDYLRAHAEFDFNGNPIYNQGIAEAAEQRRQGKTAYCADCGEKICSVDKIRRDS